MIILDLFKNYYSGKWFSNTYLWVAKVGESLGLSVNLKVKIWKLESVGWQSGVIEGALFIF